jgi:hypothetical protein
MELAGVLLGLLGIVAAIIIPLWIEALKRPQLSIARAEDEDREGMPDAMHRVLKLMVVNQPLEGWLGKWVLRDTASGCKAKVTILPLDDRPEDDLCWVDWFYAMWDAKPRAVDADGELDQLRVPDAQVYDVPPSRNGSGFPVAIRRSGMPAYAFAPEIYIGRQNGPSGSTLMRNDALVLEDGDYSVLAEAEAGGVSCSAKYRLRVQGGWWNDVELEPMN